MAYHYKKIPKSLLSMPIKKSSLDFSGIPSSDIDLTTNGAPGNPNEFNKSVQASFSKWGTWNIKRIPPVCGVG